MANENAAIWQCQSGVGAAEATVLANSANDVALFNDSAKVIGASSVSYIENITVDFRRATPENEAVDTDNNEIQDMGIEGFDIVITGISGDTNNDANTNLVNKLSKWLQEGNTETGFTKGRYGLRLDNAPQWNVVPTSALGYHLAFVNFQYIGEHKDAVKFTIKLLLGGDIKTAI